MEETPVVTQAVEEPKAAPAKGPAHELRQAQALLAGGLFPGQMAPAITEAFVHLDKLAAKIELDAKNEAEFKARQSA